MLSSKTWYCRLQPEPWWVAGLTSLSLNWHLWHLYMRFYMGSPLCHHMSLLPPWSSQGRAMLRRHVMRVRDRERERERERKREREREWARMRDWGHLEDLLLYGWCSPMQELNVWRSKVLESQKETRLSFFRICEQYVAWNYILPLKKGGTHLWSHPTQEPLGRRTWRGGGWEGD